MEDIGARPAGGGGWIVSPLFDILFFANVYWLFALFPWYVTPEGTPYIAFWAAYFIATPHRWMTIVLAAGDRDRRYGRTWLFVLLAAITAVAIVAVYDGSYKRLALFYAILVGWHFATQHAGILRMYGRKAGDRRRWLDTWPPRIFVMYASIRLMPGLDYLARDLLRVDLPTVDWIVLGLPAAMIVVELLNRPWQRVPKLLYLVSFSGVYSALILAAQSGNEMLGLALLTAATVFHSVEYLALSCFYAKRRETLGSDGFFRKMAVRWTTVFAWFVVTCGLIYSYGDSFVVAIWFGINLWASILHCIYDGMMWRLRDPATAEVLDVAMRQPAPEVGP